MRRSITGLAVAAVTIATPATARDDSWYIEADAGATWVQNLDVAIESSAFDSTTGYDVGAIAGYDFGSFRLEGEASYRRAPIDQVVQIGGPATMALDGKASNQSFMLNGLLDFGNDDGLQFYAGAGAGIGNTKVEWLLGSPGVPVGDSDWGFAWQGLAGVRLPISDKVDVGLKYRYFNQNNITLFPSTTDAPFQTDWHSHSAMLTLAYNFLPPPPPVEVVEVTPPLPIPVEPPIVGVTPPTPPPVCNKGPYIVFFDWDKSDITPEAASILDSAVTAYGNCANVPIMLAGYTDRSGSATYNQALSERRNASVTDYLTTRGVPSGAITSQGFGETNNRVPTADGVKELQNRRVEITYGPGSGM